ncbi:MAG: hypothetical protein IJF84_03370 [Thermoguttaceae bacterium]|nr:hypothetical protein [Thermoguttaceae bacterium]
MSKVYYLYGLPLERVSDNVFRPRAKGRPSDTGSYGERTVVRRIPESLIDTVDRLLTECRSSWESIREGVLNGTYTSPEIDLATLQMLPREPSAAAAACSQGIPVGVSSDGSGDTVTESLKQSGSNEGHTPSDPVNSGVITLTKSQRKKQKWQQKRR